MGDWTVRAVDLAEKQDELNEMRQQKDYLLDVAMILDIDFGLPQLLAQTTDAEAEEMEAEFRIADDYLDVVGKWFAFMPKGSELMDRGERPLNLLLEMGSDIPIGNPWLEPI